MVSYFITIKIPYLKISVRHLNNFILLLWYGKTGRLNFKTTYKRKKINYNIKTKSLAFLSPKWQSLSIYKSSFYVPSNWNLVLLSSKNLGGKSSLLYLYSSFYYFKVTLQNIEDSWYYDSSANLFSYKNPFLSNFHRFYWSVLQKLFDSFSLNFFRKLKIKGKGYYIYKNYRNTVTHQFGHSHRTYIYTYFTTVKFLSKTTVLLFGSSKNDVFSAALRIRSSKYINIFTGRGVRFSKQIVYKKTGKVSAYR